MKVKTLQKQLSDVVDNLVEQPRKQADNNLLLPRATNMFCCL
jgi:hypothetical protein